MARLHILLFFFPVVLSSDIRMQRDFRHPKYPSFPIFWNAPSFMCQKHGIDFSKYMKQWEITANPDDSFRGALVNILYDPGLFPALLKSSCGQTVERNGGIPQLGNLTKHLQQFEKVVEQLVPKNFTGPGVIDFEAYRLIFRQNWNDQVAYLTMSRELERQKHPSWDNSRIEQNAKVNFESAARIFFQSTLNLVKILRPKGTWGYYGYPYCYNYRQNNGMVPWCNKDVQLENNRIQWLFDSSTGHYPSLYLSNNLEPRYRANFFIGRLNEAWRMASRSRAKRIPAVHPYMWYKYTDATNFLSAEDIYNAIETTRRFKMGGLIIWGASNDYTSKEKCQDVLDYLNNVLGPAILRSKRNANKAYNDEYVEDGEEQVENQEVYEIVGLDSPNVIYTAVGNNDSKSIFQYDVVSTNKPIEVSSYRNDTRFNSTRNYTSRDVGNPAAEVPVIAAYMKWYERFLVKFLGLNRNQ